MRRRNPTAYANRICNGRTDGRTYERIPTLRVNPHVSQRACEITTHIDIDTMTPQHSVDIAGEDGMPGQLVKAAAAGGAKALLISLGEYPPDQHDDMHDDTTTERN